MKKFVAFDLWDQFGVGEEFNNPGPIDNSSLLAGKALAIIRTTLTV